MILDTMTFDEVFHLLKEDLPQVSERIKYLNEEFTRKTRHFKNRERIWHNPREFKSKNGFNFTIQFFSDPVSFPPQERLKALYYCWFVIRGKMYVYTLSLAAHSYGHVKVYTSHFLDRYNERFLKNPVLSKLETFRLFIMNNPKGAIKENYSEEYPEGIIEVVNNGIVFGMSQDNKELNCHISLMKTFISWDMIGQDQQQVAMEGKVILKELGIDLDVPEDDFLPIFGNTRNEKYIKTERIDDSIKFLKEMGSDNKIKGLF